MYSPSLTTTQIHRLHQLPSPLERKRIRIKTPQIMIQGQYRFIIALKIPPTKKIFPISEQMIIAGYNIWRICGMIQCGEAYVMLELRTGALS